MNIFHCIYSLCGMTGCGWKGSHDVTMMTPRKNEWSRSCRRQQGNDDHIHPKRRPGLEAAGHWIAICLQRRRRYLKRDLCCLMTLRVWQCCAWKRREKFWIFLLGCGVTHNTSHTHQKKRDFFENERIFHIKYFISIQIEPNNPEIWIFW